jgi:PPOX class probable F420-dependent enzyme
MEKGSGNESEQLAPGVEAGMFSRRNVLEVLAGLAVELVFGSPARADEPALAEEVRRALRTADLLYVATRRRSGERSTSAPIWFHYDGSFLYFTTSPTSWKARRIRRGSPLYIRVGDPDGPALIGYAEPLTDPATIDRMGEAYSEKYWIAWLGFFRPRSDRVAAGKTVAYRVRLAEDRGQEG